MIKSIDPRFDLEEDTFFWTLVLLCAKRFEDKNIFANLHGFRCSGATLTLKDNNLIFQFSNEWDKETKEKYKQKYAVPYLKEFKIIFKFVAENFEKIQKYIEQKKEDIFERDLFLNYDVLKDG